MALIRLNNQSLTSVTALPTGLGGKVVKTASSRIDTTASIASATMTELADFGSFTPSLTTSTIYITANAVIAVTASNYFNYKWVVDGVDYHNTDVTNDATAGYYTTNNYQTRPCPMVTSVSNTDGSAITVALHARAGSGNTLYLNRSVNQTDANHRSGGISEVVFVEVAS